jgi:hypothetical protein
MDRKQTRPKSRKVKPIIDDIANEKLVQILENLADQVGVQVRHEKGDFHSAGCRVVEQKLIILKKTDQDDLKAKALLGELAKFDTKSIDIPPAIQEQLSLIRQQAVEENSAV